MKRSATLEMDTKGQLKVKKHRTIIHTEEEVQDVFHFMIQEGEEDEVPEEDVIVAPP